MKLSRKSFCRKNDIRSFRVRIQRARAAIFQKAADSKGRAFGRASQGAKSSAFIRIRKGDAAARWAVASWETLSRGFPMRRLTPHKSCTTPKREPSTLVQACNAKRIQHLNRFIPALHLLLAKALFHGTIRRPSSIIRPLPLVCNRLPPCGGKSQARSRL